MHNSKTKYTKVVVVFLVILLSSWLAFFYKIPLYSKIGNNYNIVDYQGAAVIRKKGVYDGQRFEKSKWEAEFITGLLYTGIEINNTYFYPYINYPEKVSIQGENYYPFNVGNSLYLVKDLKDFKNYLPVMIYEDYVKWPNYSPVEAWNTYVNNKLVNKKNCNKNDYSFCLNLLKSVELSISPSKDEYAEISVKAELENLDYPTFVSNGLKIPPGFKLCLSEQNCLESSLNLGKLDIQNYPVIFLEKNGVKNQTKTIRDLNLDQYTFQRLFLPDEISTVNEDQEAIQIIMNQDNLSDIFLIHPSGAVMTIKLDQKNTSEVSWNSQYNTLNFKSRECTDTNCQLNFKLNVS